MIRRLSKLFTDRRGATAIEYSVILALIAIACIGALVALGGSSAAIWNNVSTSVGKAG